jgi:hypothetical protein
MLKLGLPLKARYRISGDVFTHKEGLRSFKLPMTTSVQVGRRAACSRLDPFSWTPHLSEKSIDGPSRPKAPVRSSRGAPRPATTILNAVGIKSGDGHPMGNLRTLQFLQYARTFYRLSSRLLPQFRLAFGSKTTSYKNGIRHAPQASATKLTPGGGNYGSNHTR